VRKVAANGIVTTIAGTGVVPSTQAQLGEGGPATAAAVFERTLQSAVEMKSENDLTV